jgi:NDP-sugar pyrophosphorylase family protein
MKAMLFAAGLGTRLRPYTNDRPKALVEVQGKTLLQIALERLHSFGVEETVVNVHHFADKVEKHLSDHHNFGLNIRISDERNLLLDTGGGLAKVADYLNDAPFLIHNVDILSDLDLSALYEAHLQHDRPLSTLAVRQRETSRYLEFSPQGTLTGWKNKKTGERRVSRPEEIVEDWAYSGMAVIDPELFAFFPENQPVFSIIDVWLAAARENIIRNFPHDDTLWLDVGKPAALEAAQNWKI